MVLDFHEKRKLKGYLYSKYAVVGLGALSVLLGVATYERYLAERKVAHKRVEIQEELEGLKQRASLLDAEVARLKSDRGLEEEIRDRYEVSKSGEKVVVIVGDSEKKEEIATSSEEKVAEEKKFFWSFLQ